MLSVTWIALHCTVKKFTINNYENVSLRYLQAPVVTATDLKIAKLQMMTNQYLEKALYKLHYQFWAISLSVPVITLSFQAELHAWLSFCILHA